MITQKKYLLKKLRKRREKVTQENTHNLFKFSGNFLLLTIL